VRPLLTAVRVATGQVDPTAEPFLSMVLVAPDHIEASTGRLLATKTAAEQRAISGKYVFDSGDVVYSKIRPYLRKAIVAKFPGLCSADMYPLKPGVDISSPFILAVLLGHHFSTYAESVSVRSGMPKINRAELADYSFALPPLSEQRAIAAALSDVDALLEGLTRLIAKKRDLKQAAMQQLLTGQTRLPGFHGEWEAAEFGDVAIIRNAKLTASGTLGAWNWSALGKERGNCSARWLRKDRRKSTLSRRGTCCSAGYARISESTGSQRSMASVRLKSGH
jgi:type I restriction enzyme, S subunit